MTAEGFSDAENQPPLYYIEQQRNAHRISIFREEKAQEIVITNTNKIADSIEK